MVGQKENPTQPSLPTRTEHEMRHDELAPSVKQIGKGSRSAGTIEGVTLLDLHPCRAELWRSNPSGTSWSTGAMMKVLMLKRKSRRDPYVVRFHYPLRAPVRFSYRSRVYKHITITISTFGEVSETASA
jgi:hypothetical protein